MVWPPDSKAYTLLENEHDDYEMRTAFELEPKKTGIAIRENMGQKLRAGDIIAFHRGFKAKKSLPEKLSGRNVLACRGCCQRGKV